MNGPDSTGKICVAEAVLLDHVFDIKRFERALESAPRYVITYLEVKR
jgi:hypothetical protein